MTRLIDAAERLILSRRATRAFLTDEVPSATLKSVFTLAGSAPSNSNTQPWHVEVVSGATRDRLAAALLSAHRRRETSLDFPYHDDLYHGIYQQRREDAGAQMYGSVGIARHDVEAREAFNAKSLGFYGAPHVALLFTSPRAEARMAADVGIYTQTLLLAMTAHGIASCPQGMLSFYADTIRDVLDIADRKLLLGISFGYADEAAPANAVRMPRAPLAETTHFHH